MIDKIDHVVLDSLHNGRAISLDIRFKSSPLKKPVVIFVHGFKGFKDWGHFNQIADSFAESGFVFLKLNLSHNGTSPQQLFDFVDLEGFSLNNFSIELDDLQVVIDYIFSPDFKVPDFEIDLDKLFMIGHSRGGSITILKASEDNRIKGLATWAAVSDLKNFWGDDLIARWKEEEVLYIPNARTGQDMPMKFQIVEDFLNNHDRLDIPLVVSKLTKPFLICHGDSDESVSVGQAHQLKSWCPSAELEIVRGATHTFGGVHPWDETALPTETMIMVKKTIEFFSMV